MSETPRREIRLAGHVLFRVISRICKYSGIKSSIGPVAAADDYTVLPSLYKIVIQNNFPLLMEELSVTVSHER
jgi:hypothetical protein